MGDIFFFIQAITVSLCRLRFRSTNYMDPFSAIYQVPSFCLQIHGLSRKASCQWKGMCLRFQQGSILDRTGNSGRGAVFEVFSWQAGRVTCCASFGFLVCTGNKLEGSREFLRRQWLWTDPWNSVCQHLDQSLICIVIWWKDYGFWHMNLDYLFLLETIGFHEFKIVERHREKGQRTFAASLYNRRGKYLNVVL